STAAAGDGTALTYGLGHGGAEAWLVGVLVQIQWILFAVLENRGELDGYLSNLPADSLMRIHVILASLTPQTAGIFALERVAAPVRAAGADVIAQGCDVRVEADVASLVQAAA
ncbi:YhfC family glutamic-type intramembrane protease, partial [Paraburkholderia sp. SIMBA_049]